jgi:hypothetical protein
MRLLTTTAFAALLFGTTVSMSALAASPPSTGCSPGAQRAESEGGGVGSVGQTTRHADTEGGGVGSVGQTTRHADTEGGGVGSVGQATRHADTEGGGVGSVGQATRHADAEGGGVGQATGKQMAASDPCK